MQEIQSLKEKGMDCGKMDKRTDEQKIIDDNAYNKQIIIKNKLARENYRSAVKSTARFLDDVEAERMEHKNTKLK